MRRFVAVGMMMLVVLLPVAFAQDLSIVKFQGSAGVNGYARSVDDVTIEVLTSLGGLPVNESRVRLYLGSNYDLFQRCVQDSGDFYRCTYEAPMQWYGALDFGVKLYDYEVPPNIVAEAAQSILIDDIPPTVRSFSASPQTTDGPVEFSFAVEDYGSQYGVSQECSGVKKVTISADGEELVTDFGEAGVCSRQRTVDYTFTGDGEQTVCAKVEDFLGLESPPSCVSVVVDNAAPNMSGFAIVDPSGNFQITHVKPGEQRNAHVLAVIRDEGGVDAASVRGYFAQLNQNFPDFIPPTRIIQNSVFVWENIPVAQVDNCQAMIRADDVLGNRAERSFPCDIAGDDVAPTVVNVSAGQVEAGRYLVGYDSPIRVTFEDLDSDGNRGVGLQSRNAFLDLSDLGLSDDKRADSCTFKDPWWECTWVVQPQLPSGDYVAFVTTDTRDDLNNALGQPYRIDLTFDKDGPQQPVIMESRVVGQQADRQAPVRGDTLVYTVRSADFVRSYANFSEIGGQDRVQPVGCSPTDVTDEFDCTFQSYIFFSGYLEGRVEFNFFDEANNRASVADDVIVYDVLNDTNPDYWTHSVECSPSGSAGADTPLVDRQLNPQMGQAFSCVARLRPNAPGRNLTTVSIVGPQAMLDCSADNIGYFEEVFTLNTGEGSTEPILFFTMAPVELNANHSLVSCPLHITSVKGGAITPHAEREDVLINVSYYNEPLTTLYENYEERIERQFDKVDGFSEWMDPLRDFVAIAQGGCRIKNTLANVLGVIQSIVAMVESVEAGLDVTLGLGGILRPARVGICESAEASQAAYENTAAPFLDGLCAVANCQAVTGKDWTRFIGGGMPWCQASEQYLRDMIGTEATAQPGQGGWQGVDIGNQLPVQDSLTLSTACMCLPGIIRNLDKLRQNECKRATCMARDYVTQGLAASVCDENYHYLTCTYITGEVYSVMNFFLPLNFIDQVSDLIAEWIANPFSIATSFWGLHCQGLCHANPGIHAECAIPRMISVLAEAVGSVEAMVEAEDVFGKDVGNEWCAEYEEVRQEWDAEVA